jgi:hypothetical protein
VIREGELVRLLQAKVELDEHLPMRAEAAKYIIKFLVPTILTIIRDEVAEERRAKREVQF